MWTASWQADGDMRYEIATCNRIHTAVFERDEFIKRMTHPERGVWFTWLESDTGEARPTMNWKQWCEYHHRWRSLLEMNHEEHPKSCEVSLLRARDEAAHLGLCSLDDGLDRDVRRLWMRIQTLRRGDL